MTTSAHHWTATTADASCLDAGAVRLSFGGDSGLKASGAVRAAGDRCLAIADRVPPA